MSDHQDQIITATPGLVLAALETAWHWATKDLSTVERGRWPKDWDKTLRTAATKRGVKDDAAPTNLKTARLEIGALRNFLQHGDDRAREKLAASLPDFKVPESLNSALAGKVVRDADLLFQRFAAMTGGEVVGSAHSGWIPNPYRVWGD